jgi:amino acid adenylation domain-containing protein
MTTNPQLDRDTQGAQMTRTLIETLREYPQDLCLPDLLEKQVQQRPEALAVVDEDRGLTYRALDRASTMLANDLHHRGAARDECVGVFIEPSLELMVGIWGILKAGSAYLALSPDYPVDRLRLMIEQSRTRILVCSAALQTRLFALAPPGTLVVTCDDAAFAPTETGGAERCRADGPRPNSLAYVIFTSGSTGKPKGVMIEHHSIVNQMLWLADVHRISPRTKILHKTLISFDAAQWEILAVAIGALVVMGAPGIHRDPQGIIDTILRHRVTALQCVPTLLQALLDTDAFHRCTSLTQVFSGGEALTRQLAADCLAMLRQCELVNLYGPTECTINSSAYAVDMRTVKDGSHAVSIGKPVRNTCYHVLDERRQPVGIGEVGELYIGGKQLARGYLYRDDLTAERFSDDPFCGHGHAKLYRTGDLVRVSADGNVHFAGRSDRQVKWRGVRIELQEVEHRIQEHLWVKSAAVLLIKDNLVAFIELNPRQAALMDQGNHVAHHQSKQSGTQVRKQLENPGCREAADLAGRPVLELPGKTPTARQKRRVFARKTYRTYDGPPVRKADILRLLAGPPRVTAARRACKSRRLDRLRFAQFGALLRYFGQFHSKDRLLPKYGYASPGALYATQMYVEIDGLWGLTAGYYYYHPVEHQLVLIRAKTAQAAQAMPQIKLHFVGKQQAIEPIYKNNIREVLEIEAGHMVGLFQAILPAYGLGICDLPYEPQAKDHLDCALDDFYLGTFGLVPHVERATDDDFDIYVQSHSGKIADLPAGLYHHVAGTLRKVSDEMVLKNQVIAINQQVYERASLGITLISRTGKEWMRYIELGRKLQLLQMNDGKLGFMSSGYSSKTGHDLPSAQRIDSILRGLGRAGGPSYFCVGGRISDAQRASQGMQEDLVHTQGPAEMIKEDLAQKLHSGMMPNRFVILDELPQTVNGKVDLQALAQLDVASADRPFVAPRTPAEARLAELWKEAMKLEAVSVQDNFFYDLGGNSLHVMGLVPRIEEVFQRALPLRILHDAPTIEQLAHVVVTAGTTSSRLLPLQSDGTRLPVYCWPGLGGYPMSLRPLATRLGRDRPFLGVQVYGLHSDEVAYRRLGEMAAHDIALIKQRQPRGPYTLWGYSFGARVAFETAYQLEKAGDVVEELFLIAPGAPRVRGGAAPGGAASYADRGYLTILFSVFSRTIVGPELEECLRTVRDEASLIAFICKRHGDLAPQLVQRIAQVVATTYALQYAPGELAQRRLAAPITVFRATGDHDSFIEGGAAPVALTVIQLEADHYGLLQEPGVDELVRMIRSRRRAAHALRAGLSDRVNTTV